MSDHKYTSATYSSSSLSSKEQRKQKKRQQRGMTDTYSVQALVYLSTT